MDLLTHAGIDRSLCGTPVSLAPSHAQVELTPTPAMAADASGLVHGGFIFGLADYAAMLAVNQHTVVLAAAEVRFLRPSRVGETLRAQARVTASTPPKYTVHCTVQCGEETVFEGDFRCVVPARHVLSGRTP
jgi:uncharacterized protein (TIGR00369 family)